MSNDMTEEDIEQVIATGEFLPSEYWEAAMSVVMFGAPTFDGNDIVEGEE